MSRQNAHHHPARRSTVGHDRFRLKRACKMFAAAPQVDKARLLAVIGPDLTLLVGDLDDLTARHARGTTSMHGGIAANRGSVRRLSEDVRAPATLH
ncbi:hypothetical protein [Burkholderia anthina]|uniref:hypothetical protein n=2 Tax=Burkholderiaceae TaxID=119060 RepID=UPI00158B9CB4|nr:hypothetical protein [Burkholderia anthina]